MKSTFKCDKCKDVGSIYRYVDGDLFARPCECTERAIAQSRLKFADIPEEFTEIKVSDFKSNLYTDSRAIELASNAKTLAKNYILNFQKYKDLGKGLYFYSKEKGSGKTMLSIAIGNAIMNMHKLSVKFVTTVDLLGEIKKTYDKNSEIKESELINTLKKVPVLILDDIGTEKPTGWVNEILYQILNTRMTSQLITIFTSNVHISELQHDSRIISRIEKMAIPLQMPEQSIRGQQAKLENQSMIDELLKM